MSSARIAPSATDSPNLLADWVELQAILSSDKVYSVSDLVAEFRRSGSSEAVGDPEDINYRGDIGSESSQDIAQDAFSEIENRSRFCGGEEGTYPFKIGVGYIELKGTQNWNYIFLLLLSNFGKDKGPKNINAPKLFEEICAVAAEYYFGGTLSMTYKEIFGFPRIVGPRGFKKALNRLCIRMGEGGGHKESPVSRDQKDAKLDIVIWKEFPDKNTGKLIAFGQCATGKNWESKTTELQSGVFCDMWLHERPSVMPLRLFFIPHIIEYRLWRKICLEGGILFDRCRIAYHLRELDTDVQNQCRKWSEYVLKRL